MSTDPFDAELNEIHQGVTDAGTAAGVAGLAFGTVEGANAAAEAGIAGTLGAVGTETAVAAAGAAAAAVVGAGALGYEIGTKIEEHTHIGERIGDAVFDALHPDSDLDGIDVVIHAPDPDPDAAATAPEPAPPAPPADDAAGSNFSQDLSAALGDPPDTSATDPGFSVPDASTADPGFTLPDASNPDPGFTIPDASPDPGFIAPDASPDPGFTAPDVSVPDLSMPDLSMPDLSTPDLSTPDAGGDAGASSFAPDSSGLDEA
jgi:hypothetical protein